MIIIEIGLMWAFAFAVFTVVTRWRMGAVSDQRAGYWSKYEGK